MRTYGITNIAPYSSAPAVGLAGDAYYNTGSKILFLSDGTTWNPNQADVTSVGLGIVAWGSVTDGINVPANTWTAVSSVINFTPLTGRRYRIHWGSRAVGPNSCIFQFNLYNGASKDSTTNPIDWYQSTPGAWQGAYMDWMVDGDNAARTWQVFASYGGTTGQQMYGGHFYVEDMGKISGYPGTIPPTATNPWTQFTAVMYCDNSQATITSDAAYTRVGRLITARFRITAVAYPTGQYNINLPVQGKVPTATNAWGSVIGTGAYVSAGGANYAGTVYYGGTSGWSCYIGSGSPITSWKQAGPPVQANVNDEIFLMVNYEAAA